MGVFYVLGYIDVILGHVNKNVIEKSRKLRFKDPFYLRYKND